MTKKITWYTTSSTTFHTSNDIHNINNEKRENKQTNSIRESLFIFAGTIVTIVSGGVEKKATWKKFWKFWEKFKIAKKNLFDVDINSRYRDSRYRKFLVLIKCYMTKETDKLFNIERSLRYRLFEIMIHNWSFSVLCFTMLKVSKPEIQSRASLKVGWS